jgi:hypothetical protein
MSLPLFGEFTPSGNMGRALRELYSLSLPLCSLEEMARGLLSCILIGHNDAAHFVVLLEHSDHALC